ncbi:MAG: hypothetical protein K2M61_02320 [Muribaculaceae bacterium]|nr:hypothetical protein [Muribaculaceae bacterium]
MGYNTPAFHKAGDIVLPHTRTESTAIVANALGMTPLERGAVWDARRRGDSTQGILRHIAL